MSASFMRLLGGLLAVALVLAGFGFLATGDTPFMAFGALTIVLAAVEVTILFFATRPPNGGEHDSDV
jgi:hypothetical protein